jgi:hypothetical protein
VESDEWIGTLIHANEELVRALEMFEKADKDIDKDSDSDIGSSSSEEEEGFAVADRAPGMLPRRGRSLNIEKLATEVRNLSATNSGSRTRGLEGKEIEQGDLDDPFNDLNAVETPVADKSGMAW